LQQDKPGAGTETKKEKTLKEKGVDLMKPTSRETEALVFYYKSLIEYSIKHFVEQFKAKCQLAMPRPIPIIVSGGTSMAGGFMDLFKIVFEKYRKRFPLEVSEIRQAAKPLNAVAQGLLVQAIQEYEE